MDEQVPAARFCRWDCRACRIDCGDGQMKFKRRSGEKQTLRMGGRGPGSGEAGKRVFKVLDIDGMGEPTAIISSQRGGS